MIATRINLISMDFDFEWVSCGVEVVLESMVIVVFVQTWLRADRWLIKV